VFANGGVRLNPYFVRLVRDSEGQSLFRNEPRPAEVLDPRVAYIVTNMMEDVINRGTAARVRSMDFREPAAGKTGTDEDGWFAGFTDNLICVVWVGFDDNTDIKLEGAHSALPIWARFMKKAHAFHEYRNPKPFQAVEGTVTVEIDTDARELATYSCPNRRAEVFIAGTQPNHFCRFHGGEGMRLATSVAGWDSSPAVTGEVPMRASADPERGAEAGESLEAPKPSPARPVPAPTAAAGEQQEQPRPQGKKKGIFGRIVGIFK
jgi:penicillin-binding protein 1B